MIHLTRIVRVVDASAVADARRSAAECAAAEGMSEAAAGRVALVATELATNLVKHGDGGAILIGSNHARGAALTLVAIDQGRGIDNVQSAIRDGFSTAGSPGTGLGAIARATTSFSIYTVPERGTAVHCVITEGGSAAPPPLFEVAGLSLPKPGEDAFGDAWTAVTHGATLTVMVADGLGHGPSAATASAAAVRVAVERAALPLEQLMAETNAALRPTRGAAVGMARIQHNARRVDFAGIGNIAAAIVDGEGMRRTVSLPGIVGAEIRKVQVFSYPWPESSALIMHSDGISSSWTMNAYPGLMQHAAALVAAVLYRDHGRGTDDATIVVARAA